MYNNAKLASLLRKVFLGSIAGIVSGNTATANNYAPKINLVEEENNLELMFNKKMDLSPKLILKVSNDNEWSFASHRSHRSHSSHQSHRSHYSSYSGGKNTEPKSNSGIQPNNNYNYNKENNNTVTTDITLGSRILKKGMSGTDVTELINILLKKQYLKLEDGGKHVTGVYTYDDTIEGAIKEFQKDNGLKADGVCGATTVYYLKNK